MLYMLAKNMLLITKAETSGVTSSLHESCQLST